MTNREVIAKLQKLDPNAEARVYCEGLEPTEFFEIDDVQMVQAEGSRDEDGIPHLKFGRTNKSSEWLLIRVCADLGAREAIRSALAR